MAQKHLRANSVRIFPKTCGHSEQFGRFEGGEWRDGVVTANLR